MPLTPADVHNVAFSKPPIGKRGYNEDEVDAFLDLVETELTRLVEENSDLRQRVAELDQELASARAGDGASTQVTQAIPLYEPEPEPVKPPPQPAPAAVAAPTPAPLAEEQAIKAAVAEFGKIDILVNNAGITRDQLVLRMKRADWDAVLLTNLTSAYVCIQQVTSSMLKQRWGRIINVASIFGQMGQAGQANYSASKAGLIGLTMAIARELGSRNITCNAVAPGFIETAMTDVLGEEFKQNAAKQIPLGRVGSPADVAAAVAFLASDEASYITGHVLNVNGGMLMG